MKLAIVAFILLMVPAYAVTPVDGTDLAQAWQMCQRHRIVSQQIDPPRTILGVTQTRPHPRPFQVTWDGDWAACTHCPATLREYGDLPKVDPLPDDPTFVAKVCGP
jgi:hypothetical protein